MYPSIQTYIQKALKGIDNIPEERKRTLLTIRRFVSEKVKEGAPVELIYICTHNSRRSHFGQIWAKVAAEYFKIPGVHTYSGGTEATAFNPNAIEAVSSIGFKIEKDSNLQNPEYKVFFDDQHPPIRCFSKKYDDINNPQNHFGAVMTCTEADGNCPVILGAELRIATPYEDPKAFDNTPLQTQMYAERCLQIATECLFVFSNITK